MPPTTSLSDCVAVFALSLAFPAAAWLTGMAGWFRLTHARILITRVRRKHPSLVVEIPEAAAAVKAFYRIPSSFVILWLPWLLVSSGSIGLFLLRDRGVLIYPRLMMINCALFSFSGIGAYFLKIHRQAHILLNTPSDAASPEAAGPASSP